MHSVGTALPLVKGISSLRVRPATRRFDPLTVTMVGVLFLALAIQLVVRLKITSYGYRLEELRQVITASDARLRQLHFDYHLYTGPQAIRRRAEVELGMKPMTPSAMRRIDK